MQRYGWTLLFHDCLIDQLRKLNRAARRAKRNEPATFASNANVKLFRRLSRLMLEVIPQNPSRDESPSTGRYGVVFHIPSWDPHGNGLDDSVDGFPGSAPG